MTEYKKTNKEKSIEYVIRCPDGQEILPHLKEVIDAIYEKYEKGSPFLGEIKDGSTVQLVSLNNNTKYKFYVVDKANNISQNEFPASLIEEKLGFVSKESSAGLEGKV